MLLDRFRKKTRPGSGGSSALGTGDVSIQTPEVDDVLAALDRAISQANRVEEQIRAHGIEERDHCSC